MNDDAWAQEMYMREQEAQRRADQKYTVELILSVYPEMTVEEAWVKVLDPDFLEDLLSKL